MTEKKHIITIAGQPGSGKSTTAKTLAARLGYEHFSSGDLFRMLGKERGLDLLNANLSAEQNAEIDHLVDQRLQEIGANDDRKVIDSRTAWHWMPNSFKVFLDLDLQTAAQRILGSMDAARLSNELVGADPAAYANDLQARMDSESRRFKALYGVDPFDVGNYDLVIDTAKHSIDEVVTLVLAGFEAWIAKAA